jgi:hypothetical protein
MESLFFAFGSALGAALAWLVGRREPSRSTVVAVNGIAGGLLGALTLLGGRSTSLAIEAGLGLFGTVAPLTLCMTPLRAVESRTGVASVVRHFAATLALALVCGISCAILGFVSVASVHHMLRHISGNQHLGQPAVYPIMMSLKPFHTPTPASLRRL